MTPKPPFSLREKVSEGRMRVRDKVDNAISANPHPILASSGRPTLRSALQALGLASAVAVLALILDHAFPLPLPDTHRDAATVVLAADGTPLRAFADREGVWRYPVQIEDVSPHYLEALIGYEDRWFWTHGGVNPLSLIRATTQALWHGDIVSGGSTLTMQVARLIEPIPRSPLGKLRQMLRAVQLEWHLSKREILTLYLDYAPFGGTLQGVQAASYGYLGKPAAQLSRAEAALLAVLPQAPSRLRPDRAPQAARLARDKVLQRLAEHGVWSDAEIQDARIEGVVARALQPPMHGALLAERLRREAPASRRIFSTIDLELQRRLEARVADWVSRLPPRTSAAVIVADTRSLEVRAYVGAARFGDDASYGHIDMATAFRSPGSTLKPFLYGLALDEGLIHSESLLIDAPQGFDGYRPGNFDSRFRGPVSATAALQQSLNVPAVALLDALGEQRFAARLAHAGLPLRLPRGAEPNLAMILGGTEARLEDLVGAYASLHRDGLAGRLRLRDEDPIEERRLLSPGAAWIVREMLQSAPRPGDSTDRFDRTQRSELAWKTGTSYGFRDAWAVGTTAGATVGVWIGRPDGTPLPGQYGAVTALPLLLAVADHLPRSLRALPSPQPSTVVETEICWPLGRRASETPAEHCHRRRPAWVLDETVPPTLAVAEEGTPPTTLGFRRDADSGLRLASSCGASHREEAASIARWPALATPWLGAAERRRATLPPLAPDCIDTGEPTRSLQIAGVVNGSVLRSAPNSTQAPRLTLRALGTREEVRWLLDGRLLGRTRADQPLLAELDAFGAQRILALDTTGRYATVDIQVMP
jgi:penicillin-binding protein 1C